MAPAVLLFDHARCHVYNGPSLNWPQSEPSSELCELPTRDPRTQEQPGHGEPGHDGVRHV